MVFGNQDNRPRPAVLSLTLLAILAITVVLAWMISHSRNESFQQATAIIRSMNPDRLASYWAKHGESWFMANDETGHPVGSLYMTLRQEPEGFFGMNITRLADFQDQEDWLIAEDAKQAKYVERVQGGKNSFSYGVNVGNGKIVLDSPRLQRGQPAAYAENYLMPGLVPLALQDVAKSGKTATFSTLDYGPFLAHRPYQMDVVMYTFTPKGPRTIEVVYHGSDATDTTVYTLDAEGGISQIEDLRNKIVYKLSTQKAVEAKSQKGKPAAAPRLLDDETEPDESDEED